MTDVVVSYARADSAAVERLVKALQAYNVNVWWDRSLEDDTAFAEVIRQKIHEAKAVIVCWSNAAEQSHWVREEAHEARHLNKYIGCLIAEGKPALGHATANMSNLQFWNGAADDTTLLHFLSLLGKAIGNQDLIGLEEAVRQSEANAAAEKARAAEAERVRAAKQADTDRRAAIAATNAVRIQKAEEAYREAERESERFERQGWRPPFIIFVAAPALGILAGLGIKVITNANVASPNLAEMTRVILLAVIVASVVMVIGVREWWDRIFARGRTKNRLRRLEKELSSLRGDR